MPLPGPKKGESKDDFIDRCMGNDTMKEEYPDTDQRYAVCMNQWEDKERKMERRSYDFDELVIEHREYEPRKIVGHAAMFNRVADIGWFRERIAPGAFADSIKEDDIRALWNHDPNHVLGRNKAGTLRLSEDEKGLKVEITPPDTQTARDLIVSIDRGDISQMSFGFEVKAESWERGKEDEKDTRTLTKAKLWDVSPVTFPAYVETDVAVRSHAEWKKKQQRKIVLRQKFNKMKK